MAGFSLKNLCTPAHVYFVVSMITVLIMAIYNYYNINIYCLGNYSCNVTNITLIFIIKVVYILFWTFVLNLICKGGGTTVSWFLVLIPYLIFLIFVVYLLLA
jgi:hypothetical protein